MKSMNIHLRALGLLAVCLVVPWAHGKSFNGITMTQLVAFNSTNTGANPYSSPVLGPDGNLYGAVTFGDTGNGTNNYGLLYEVANRLGTNGVFTALHVFNNWDGSTLSAPLTFGQDGNLYGVAEAGGSNNLGTIFEVTTNGSFTLLYSFGDTTNSLGYSVDGANPNGGLTQGRDGFFYGTTYYGGTSNMGTVFQFSTTNGSLNTLYSFTGNDGASPYEAPLVEGADGVFYGTTFAGGTNSDGTIFEITSGGTLTTLVQFNGTNGASVYNGLSFGTDGNLYGTTYAGGTNGEGTIFRVTTNGDLTTLFEFSGVTGINPEGGVIPDSNNTLYGTTYTGGVQGDGTLFQLTSNGLFTTLYSFTNTGNGDGFYPAAGVARDATGNLYGTTFYGGIKAGYGTVYRWSNTYLPTNVIIAPQANERWSNSVFTVTGATHENVGVFAVYYSLNNSGWLEPATSDNWSNWTAQITLTMPGTNTIQAYAVDGNGRSSATNTVQFVYVPSLAFAIMTVQTNGSGTVSPNYNGELLPLNGTFKMTAKASTGFGFVNWTDASNNIITNGTILSFVVVPNLNFVANFADITKPTLTITSPKTGTKESNDVFTVTGTAKDNVAVSNVLVSLNGASWTSATLSNGNSNWTAQVTLTPGTNTIAAYAVDTSGNVSVTNTVKLNYILSATLTVRINGGGSVSPAYNGASLQISNAYSMTAKAAAGSIFGNWTDASGNILTNGTTLKFLVLSNVTYEANFVDITKPTLTILTPKSGAKSSNEVFQVVGTAKDNVAISNVMVAVDDTGWTNATLYDGYWYTSVPLNPGTNVIVAYAVDTSGNISLTNSVKLDYIPSAALTVQVIGSGTVTPNYNNALLAIGNSYTMKAVPSKNSAFYYWSGTNLTMSSNISLTFVMATNLSITANFKDITPPTLSITSPTANQRVSNAVVTVTGTANDNVGVVGVGVKINQGDWVSADGTNNWTATNLPAVSGTNIVLAYAMDAAGNVSLTNTVKFIGAFPPDWATDTLAGLTVKLVPDAGDPVSVSLDLTNFSQTDTLTNGNSGVGSYQYAKDSTNTAELSLAFVAPLTLTNAGPQDIQLTWTNVGTGVFTNMSSANTGTFSLLVATNYLPTSWSGHKITATQAAGGGITTNSLTSSSKITIATTGASSTGTYEVMTASPAGVMLVVTQTTGTDAGKVSYLQLTFTSKTGGDYEENTFGSDGSLTESEFGSFIWK